MPLTGNEECGILEPNKLYLGFDKILKYAYRKGERTHTRKIVRVVDGTVYVQDPSTKDQIVVGEALIVGNTLIMAMIVDIEE